MDWYVGVLKKYAVFEGRARRKEYWMFYLFNAIISVGVVLIDGFIGSDIVSVLYPLAVLIPALAVTVRRLHDTNRSGWWLFIGLIPLVGGIIVLVFTLQDSDPYENDFGPNPKDQLA